MATCANSMRLFGLPYQFLPSVDPRMKEVSSSIGYNFVDRIISDAPTAIIIPGKAKFLPNAKDKTGTGHALISAAAGNISSLISKLSGEENKKVDSLRYYDFESDYTEYMKYVNIMCRTVATFLELSEYIYDGDGKCALQSYDWRNYRWNAKSYSSAAGSVISTSWSSTLNAIKNLPSAIASGLKGTNAGSFVAETKGSGKSGILKTNNFVQFYIDPASSASQSMSNTTSQSVVKGAMDTASSTVREFQFLANSAGIKADEITQGAAEMTSAGLDALLEGTDSEIGKALNRILGLGTRIITGENIILPEVYQSSEYGIDYTIDIHLRAPYGNKFSVYMDVIAPLLHLIALVIPKQGTSNTYGSPFLVKAYYPGVFNCNLGIVESLQISRPSSEDAWSVDNLPTEIDVQIRIKDLYSDLSMSPSNDVDLFINNSSLIDYLATVAGLDLISPQLTTKISTMINAYTGAGRDIDDNVKSIINDKIEKAFSGFISL